MRDQLQRAEGQRVISASVFVSIDSIAMYASDERCIRSVAFQGVGARSRSEEESGTAMPRVTNLSIQVTINGYKHVVAAI